MKYSLECEVDGKVLIGEKIVVPHDEKEYQFLPNEKGLLSSIKITTPVSEPEKFYSEITRPRQQGTKVAFNIKRDVDLINELEDEFQQLESSLSFSNINLKRIHWETPKEKVIPETQEERKKISIPSMNFKQSYPDDVTLLSKEVVTNIIKHKDNYKSLVIPKAFFRQGKNYFESFHYIDAFYNFYFIFEGFYGNGKSGKNLLNQFKNSDDFRNMVKFSIDNIKTNERHCNELKKLLIEFKILKEGIFDIDNMIELLQKVRGNLHHYYTRSSVKQINPFHQREYESIAFFAMGIAVRSIAQKIYEINRQLGITTD